MPVALVTGASRGLGRALLEGLAADGWTLVVDARDGTALQGAVDAVEAAAPGAAGQIHAVPGDVAEPGHRQRLAATVAGLGRLDLLVNNASSLGPTPLPGLDRCPVADLERVLRVNAVAPMALVQLVLPHLVAANGVLVDVSSDAAVEAYPGWGAYGASKAALDLLTAVLATEQPALRCYSFDPGDMRTAMAQEAFPGEDVSDRPDPATVVPALLHLLAARPPSGRYRAAHLLAATGARP